MANNEQPISILCIDGGGTRGEIAARILEYIKCHECLELARNQALNDSAQPTRCDALKMFDLVVATSAGSFLAAGLLRLDMSPESCRSEAADIRQKVFGRTLSKFSKCCRSFLGITWYDTMVLEKKLEELCTINDKSLPFMPKVEEEGPIFCAVTATRDHNQNQYVTRIISSKKVEESARNSADWNWTETMIAEPSIKLSEALRASSAAPHYFKDAKVGNFKEPFVDGGVIVDRNNPSIIALEIAELYWGPRKVDLLLSVGNGDPEPSEHPRSDRQVTSWSATLKKNIQDTEFIINGVTNPRLTHNKILGQLKNPESYVRKRLVDTNSYIRFSPGLDNDGKSLPLDETNTQKLNDWLRKTENYMYAQRFQVARIGTILAKCSKHQETAEGSSLIPAHDVPDSGVDVHLTSFIGQRFARDVNHQIQMNSSASSETANNLHKHLNDEVILEIIKRNRALLLRKGDAKLIAQSMNALHEDTLFGYTNDVSLLSPSQKMGKLIDDLQRARPNAPTEFADALLELNPELYQQVFAPASLR